MYTVHTPDVTVLWPAAEDSSRYLLRRRSVLSMHKPGQMCIRADLGTLWITVTGDMTDIVLATGTSRIFDGHASVVVSPLGGEAVASVVSGDALKNASQTSCALASPTSLHSSLSAPRASA